MRNLRVAASAIICFGTIAGANSALAQCSSSKSEGTARTGHVTYASMNDQRGQGTIVDTAVANGNFKTLVAAVKAADLASTLSGKGPFTVFAPTDEAFAKLPAGTVESLLKPENKAKLQAILKYHVIAGDVRAEQVVTQPLLKSVNGQAIAIETKGNTAMVDNAKITATDIACTNGVIHVIDTVILPETKNVVEVAQGAGSFNTLIAAAKAAGLVPALTGEGPITLFAPTDAAFAKLPKGTVESLLQPENKDKLANILKYHVVSGRVYSPDAVSAGKAETLEGGKIKIAAKGGTAMVNDAKLVKTDIDASNGVIHVIDTVLMP
ncbi:MAG: fasciclin domain-containing protein [Phycisphaerae bacterium]